MIPLGLGGVDVAANLWPQSQDTWPWNAARNDELGWAGGLEIKR